MGKKTKFKVELYKVGVPLSGGTMLSEEQIRGMENKSKNLFYDKENKSLYKVMEFEDVPAEIAELVNKNFWDLIG